MSLADPLALLALLLVPLVVILHSLTVRWRRREISSLAFWDEVLRENRASMRVRRILRNLVLLAEILAIATLVVALAGPLLEGAAGPAGDTIVVLDTTASMKAREGGSTRIDLAREKALEELAGLRRGARMLVISAGRAPRVLAGFTGDRDVLRRVIRGSAAGDWSGSIGDSVLLALSLRSAARGDGVIVITDDAFDSISPVDAARPWIRWVRVGSSRENAGITALAFRRTAAGDYEILLLVRSFFSRPVSFPLTVRAGSVEVIREQVSLDPGQSRAISLPWTGPTTGRVTAEIRILDGLDSDNRAFAVFAPARPVHVRMVGKKNVFLESAFSALPNVTIAREANVEALSPSGSDSRDVLTVYDGVPDPPVEPGACIVINAVPRGLPIRAAGAQEGLRVAGVDSRHPLMAWVSLEGMSIARALRLEAGPGFDRLALAGGLPVLLAWDQPGLKLLLIGFDIRESDLPLKAGFPVLLANSLGWFFPSWLSVHAEQVQAGSTVLLGPPAEGAVTVIMPRGTRRSVLSTGGQIEFSETSEAGFYRVEGAGPAREFAVSLVSPSESDISPRFELPADPAEQGTPGEASPRGAAAVPVPAWGAFALAAFVLIVLEWLAWLRDAGPARAGKRP